MSGDASRPSRYVPEATPRPLLASTEPIGALPAGPSWECWRAGHAEGRLIGGLINRIALHQATRYALPLERFEGAVLFWEGLGGHVSYVWSYLQVLRRAGILDRISGMVVGIPTAIEGLDSPEGSPTLREIVIDALDAHQRILSLLEPAVRPLTVTGPGS